MVEDDADQLIIRSMLLRQHGFRVVEADCYDAAICAASDDAIRCAVVDLRLPTEEVGLLLIRELKARNPALLIYVLTGSRSTGHAAELALADAVFGKGEAIRPLLERLKQLRQDV